MKKVFAVSAAAVLAGITLTACESTEPDTEAGGGEVAEDCTPAYEFTTVAEGQLTVAVPEFPPYSSPGGEGMENDMMEQIAADNCLTVAYEEVTYANTVPTVQQGRADIGIGDYYRTVERSEVITFSTPTFLDEMAIISTDGLTTVSDIESMKVGTVDGYLWVPDMQDVMGADNLQIYPSNVEMKNDLEAGRIDVGLDSFGAAIPAFEGSDYEVAAIEPDDRVASSVEAAQSGFIMSSDDQYADFREAVDATVTTWHEDGTMVEFLESYGLPASSAEVGEPRLIE
ncbi:substrate-binding periplasmic protein [Brevibacterium litoralis]|uniref:substrate-binding periplasmic protein n=1 Tax=Brevibacterium litoralis TaxID=3138935 RepID=UPI0032EDFDE3